MDIEVTGGDPCFFDLADFRQSIVKGHLDTRITDCSERFQIFRSNWLGDGDVVLEIPPAPNHLLIEWGAPHQGGKWEYTVGVRNVGTAGTTEPVEVAFDLPSGVTWTPRIARTSSPSFGDQWSCDQVGRQVQCTRDGLARKERDTLRLLFDVALDAAALQPVTVGVTNADDVRAENNTFADRLDSVAQRFGPSFAERFDANPVESELSVDLSTSAAWTADGVETASFTVLNSGSAPINDVVRVHGLGAPAVVDTESVAGDGWTCETAWGSFVCTAVATDLASGAALPALTATFVPAPDPSGDAALMARVWRPGVTTARSSSQGVDVASSTRPDLGVLALSACPPFDDCWPIYDPSTSAEPNHLARIHLVESATSALHEVRFSHNRRNDIDESTDLVAHWDPSGASLLTNGYRVPLQEVVANADPFAALRVVATGPLDPSGNVAVGVQNDVITITRLSPSSFTTVLDPGDPFRLQQAEQQLYEPVWSPDGTQVVFRRGIPPKLWITDISVDPRGFQIGADASEPRRLTVDASTRAEYNPAFSPDGSEVAFSTDSGIVIADASAGSERILTTNVGADADTHPTWSPDGLSIAFQRGQANDAPLTFPPSTGVLDRIRAHRTQVRGRFPEFRDSGVYIVPSTGGAPVLVTRGRHPTWRPTTDALPDATSELVPAPVVTGDVDLRVQHPAPDTSVPVGTLELRGAATASRPITDSVRAAFVIDQHSGRGVNRRLAGEYDRALATRNRFGARGLPREWRSASPTCDTLPGSNLIDCFAQEFERELARVGAEVGVVRPGELLDFDGASVVVASTDGDSDGVSDLLEAVTSVRYGACGIAGTPSCVGDVEGDVRDSLDEFLQPMVTLFDSLDSGVGATAYVFSAGRDDLSRASDSALASLIGAGVPVHVFSRATQARRDDIVWVVDDSVVEFDATLDATLQDFATRLPDGDTHVALVASSDLFGGAVTGSYTYVAATWPDGVSLTDRLQGFADELGLRESARTHVVFVSADGRREGGNRMEALARTFPNGAVVHVVSPEGSPGRPVSRVCETTPYPNGAGNRYYEIADLTGGTKVSLCADSWTEITDAIVTDLARPAINDCNDATSPLSQVAALTGGQCVVVDGSEPRALMPWASDPRGAQIERIDVVHNGAPPVSFPIDQTGLWAVPVDIVSGPNSLELTLTTEDGRTATRSFDVFGNTPPIAVDDAFTALPFLGTFDVLANDGDADSDDVVLVSNTPATVGSASCASDGLCTFAYVPGTTEGVSTFEYTIADGRGGTSTATVNLELPLPPIASDISIVTPAGGGSVSFDLLSAVTDPDGGEVRPDPLDQVVGTGFLSCNVVGACTYTTTETTPHEFAYRVVDDAGFSTSGRVLVTPGPAPNFEAAVSAADFLVGEEGVYSVVLTNNGAVDGELARVELNLDPNLSLVSVTGTGWSCPLTSECQLTGPIGPGASANPLEVRVVPGLEAIPTARTSFRTDGALTVVETPVRSRGIDFTGEFLNTVTLQDDFSTTIDIRIDNVGDTDGTSPVAFTLPLPTDVAFTDAGFGEFSCAETARVVTCTSAGPIAAGNSASALFFLQAGPTTPASFALRAAIQSVEDVAPGNDEFTVLGSRFDSASLLQIIPALVAIDTPSSYLFRLSDAASRDFLLLEHTLPPEVDFISVREGVGWSCREDVPRTFSCDYFPPLEFTGRGELEFFVTPNASAAGGFDVQASVSASSLPDTLSFVESIALSESIDAAAVIRANQLEVGDSSYLLAARNAGLLPTATPITLTHTVPSELSFVSATGLNWTCNNVGADVTCAHASGLVSGATSEVVEISVATASSAKPVVPIVATVALAGDVRPGNDSAQQDVPVVDGTGIDASVNVDADPLLRGLETVYRFDVRQAGDAPITSTITFTHSPPLGVDVVDIAGVGWSCFNFGTLFCDFAGPLGAGETAPTIEVRVQANALAPSEVELIGSVRVDGDQDSSNDETRVTVPVLDGPDASVDFGTVPLSVGTAGEYQIHVANVGAAVSSGVTTITHTVPNEFDLSSASGAGWSCAVVGNDVSCDTSSVVAPGDAFPPVVLIVTPQPGSSTTTALFASVASDGDANPANDTTSTFVEVASLADLALRIAASPMVAGAQSSYTLEVANQGTGASMAPYTISHDVPPSFEFLDAVGPFACASVGAGLTCTSSAPLASSDVSTLEIVVRPTVAGTIPLTANVALAGEVNVSNNNASATVDVSAGVDVAIQVAAPSAFNVGTSASYSLDVQNAGAVAENLRVEHEVPTGLIITSVSSTSWSCATVGQSVSCELSVLDSSVPTSVQIDVDVDAPASPVSLLGTVSADADVDLSNNTAAASVDALAALDVAAVVTVPPTGRVDEPYRYELSAENAGTSTIGGPIQLSHIVPDVLDVFAVTGGEWLCSSSAATLTCTHPGPLDIGVTLPTIAIDVNPREDAFPNVTVAADVAIDGDGDATNDVAFGSTTIEATPDFSVTIETETSGTVGGLLQYAFLPTATGASVGQLVELRHPVPANLDLVSVDTGAWACAIGSELRCEIVAGGSLPAVIVSGRPTSAPSVTLDVLVSNDSDRDPSNNSVSTVVPIAGGPDVGVEIVTGGFIGARTATYILRISNDGDAATLSTTEVSHQTTPELLVTNVTPPPDVTCSGVPLVCVIDPGFEPGGVREVVIEATVPTVDSVLLESVVVTVGDVNPSNDTAALTVDVIAPLDVELAVSAPATGEAGVALTYSFDARNLGEELGGELSLIHPIPSNATFVDAVGDGWSCTMDTLNLTCQRSSVGSFEIAPPLLVSVVPSGGDLSIDGTVFVDGDVNGANDSATATVVVESVDPLDCNSAVASSTELWPPNHVFVGIDVEGLDPGVVPTVTSVRQDEPVEGTGDGNTSPDAELHPDGSASVRRERSGGGDGRVYHLGFSATDGERTCEGVVTVCIPHSKKSGCVDGGPLFDSLH